MSERADQATFAFFAALLRRAGGRLILTRGEVETADKERPQMLVLWQEDMVALTLVSKEEAEKKEAITETLSNTSKEALTEYIKELIADIRKDFVGRKRRKK